MYDLAICSIMKNEAPYAKEWIDYHLLAGVDHFYLYDNESPDNLKEVLQPYVDAGIVTYTFYPGKCRQLEAYNATVNRFKFQSRYIAFIDADELIFPQNDKSIPEVVDEVLSDKSNPGGLSANIFSFGSNYYDKADYSRGVLDRFTRHNKNCIETIKTISDPRKIKVFHQPHNAQYFEGVWAVNEIGNIVPHASSEPVSVDKIRMYHYSLKSREEYAKKVQRGNADHFENINYKMENFSHDKNNEIFDDSIIKYRDKKLSENNLNRGGCDRKVRATQAT